MRKKEEKQRLLDNVNANKRVKIAEEIEIRQNHRKENEIVIKQNTRAVFGQADRANPLYKKKEAAFKDLEQSEYEQRKAHLRSLRDLNQVPVSTEEWKMKQKEHE